MYQLAVRLGRSNVNALARSLTAKQFREWEHYATLEPFNEDREDYRIASIVRVIYNTNRGKDAEAMTLEEARVPFGEPMEVVEKKPQAPIWQNQLAVARSMTALANLAEASKQKILNR